MLAMKKIRFYVNAEKADARSRYLALSARCQSLGLEETAGDDAEAIVALGGDGTILRAVREFGDRPVLGLNLGGLGYLASVGIGEAEQALSMLAEGRYSVSCRTLLEARKADECGIALNDITVTREYSGHSVRLDLMADGKRVTRYMADGLIFATPTGSTAYSLAAGGPVVMPDSASVVVTPMSPHALGVRPLVVSDAVRFTVTACPRTDGNDVRIGVYADGSEVMTLAVGESVVIAKSSRVARLIALEGYDPYDVLARKLGWSGSNVH